MKTMKIVFLEIITVVVIVHTMIEEEDEDHNKTRDGINTTDVVVGIMIDVVHLFLRTEKNHQ